jgi:hypothetical protein
VSEIEVAPLENASPRLTLRGERIRPSPSLFGLDAAAEAVATAQLFLLGAS